MKNMNIAVVDYGMGNLRSVSKALEHVAPNHTVIVTSDPQLITEAERVVFPGQGAMPDCIRELDMRGLRQVVIEATHTKPFLGICIGLQMLFERSEEGDAAGLGVFAGSVKRFATANMHDAQGQKLKVPHMGWSQVEQAVVHPLWQNIANHERFYYVHSYYVCPEDQSLVAGSTCYPDPFTCAIAKDNLFAVQFHPEKSAQAGLQLLSNFVHWQP
ncbi:MAG: imidazole glycerol phosphate synthase subunit HisH [Methylophilaceae bacterium 17-44-8]|nr:MAG: imidazole glycerol phosphate synthase subunit HisH [Methylophilales bacterium 28-44-11]OZA06206.1 MAG: imidazole glycerol phosphate synthase subunit HisH [Methylophilaceae bacterium 17-44-8]